MPKTMPEFDAVRGGAKAQSEGAEDGKCPPGRGAGGGGEYLLVT